MNNSKHVFIQIDTEEIYRIYRLYGSISSRVALQCASIYERGLMTRGNQIKSFEVDIDEGEEVRFVVLPSLLDTTNMLYYTGITYQNLNSLPIVPIRVSAEEPHLSLQLFTSNLTRSDLEVGIQFKLEILMRYETSGVSQPITFSIDPVLKLKQR